MVKKLVLGTIAAALMAGAAWAAEYGTAAEAKAMLEKAARP